MFRFAFPPQGVLQYPAKLGVQLVDVLLLVTSVADPESGTFLTPGSGFGIREGEKSGSGMGKKSVSGMNISDHFDHFSESLETVFRVRNT
jgi:hypothetical protein